MKRICGGIIALGGVIILAGTFFVEDEGMSGVFQFAGWMAFALGFLVAGWGASGFVDSAVA